MFSKNIRQKSTAIWHIMAILVLVCGICGTACAQTVEKALELFDKNNDADAANQLFAALAEEQFLDEQVNFTPATPADSLRQQVWYWAAEWFYDRQQYKKALQYAQKALPLYHPSNPEKSACLNTLGCIYVRLGDFRKAAEYAKQSVEMDMRGGNDDEISSSLNTLAGIYMAGYQAKEAEQIILQAIDHANRADNPARKAVILGMASEIYHTLSDDTKALPYAEQAIEIEKQLGNKLRLAIRMSQKGSALLGLHRYQEAETLYRQIIPDLKEAGDWHSYAIALNRLGMSLLCQKRQAEAIPYYKEAATLFAKMGDLYNEIHAHRGLYESYWDIDPDSAKKELELFDLMKDSLYTMSTAEALSRYNAEFGNDRLLQENAKVRRAHLLTITIGIALILLIILAVWLISRCQQNRQSRQTRLLVEEIKHLRSCLAEKSKSEQETKAQPTPSEAETEEDKEERLFLIRVIETVNANMPEGNVGVEKIASELNMSVQTFRRRLLRAAGETPKTFIQAIQMERAVQLLTDSQEMLLSTIANQCGFEDTSSFGHTFKRIYGCSPSQYRERQQHDENSANTTK